MDLKDYCTLFSLIISLVSVSILFFNAFKNSKKDNKADTQNFTITQCKLDTLIQGVDDIRLENKARDGKIEAQNERLIIVEQSVKSAHKRIDSLENNKEGE